MGEDQRLPLVARLQLYVFALARHFYIRRDGTINRRILGFFDRKAPAAAAKRVGTAAVSTSDVVLDPTRSLWFRLFVPSTADASDKLPLVVYFHGGGFNTFAPDSRCYDTLCSHLAAKTPAVVASVNYRLSPEHRYPCQFDDAYDALKLLTGEVLPANADLNSCFIAGDSAGGNIAHHVAVRAAAQSREITIAGVIELQPFFGGEERTASEERLNKAPVLDVKQTDWMWRMFLPEGADRNHHAAHVLNDETAEEMKGIQFPSTLVIVGGRDPLQDWQRRYVDGLKKCGKEVELIEYPSAFHGFYLFPKLPEFDFLITGVANFIHRK